MNPGVTMETGSQGAMQCHVNWPAVVKTTVKVTTLGVVPWAAGTGTLIWYGASISVNVWATSVGRMEVTDAPLAVAFVRVSVPPTVPVTFAYSAGTSFETLS